MIPGKRAAVNRDIANLEATIVRFESENPRQTCPTQITDPRFTLLELVVNSLVRDKLKNHINSQITSIKIVNTQLKAERGTDLYVIINVLLIICLYKPLAKKRAAKLSQSKYKAIESTKKLINKYNELLHPGSRDTILDINSLLSDDNEVDSSESIISKFIALKLLQRAKEEIVFLKNEKKYLLEFCTSNQQQLSAAVDRFMKETKTVEDAGYASLLQKELCEMKIWSQQITEDLSLFDTLVELDDSSDEEYVDDHQYNFTEDLDDI